MLLLELIHIIKTVDIERNINTNVKFSIQITPGGHLFNIYIIP